MKNKQLVRVDFMYFLPRLKEVRLMKNMKQKDVCMILNMKQSQYSRYESGEDEMKIGTLIEICKAFDISADYILELSDIALQIKH